MGETPAQEARAMLEALFSFDCELVQQSAVSGCAAEPHVAACQEWGAQSVFIFRNPRFAGDGRLERRPDGDWLLRAERVQGQLMAM